MAEEISNEPDANRYVLRIDGAIAGVLDYRINGGAISMTRAFTQPQLRGTGVAARLTAFAVDDVERTTSYSIVPMCWYVGDWFERHPERAGLLSR